MNRVSLDQGLAPNAANAIHVCEVGMSSAADEEILRFAWQESRVCVTLDHDFHTHFALSLSDGPSVGLVRIEGLDSIQQADLIKRVWAACAEDVVTGAPLCRWIGRRELRRRSAAPPPNGSVTG